jgi:hypothetical protein
MHRSVIAALGAIGLTVTGCGGGAGAGKRASGQPTFKQAESVALSQLTSCPGKRAGTPTGITAVTSADQQRLKITDNATLECAGDVILHWFRFKDAAAAQSFSATERTVGLQNPFLVNGDVVVRVGNTRDVPANARSLVPMLAALIKSACGGCGVIVQP